MGYDSTLTKDTITKVVEFLMTFNSRTCQLVLGAGAMRSAGLKHITAKHLGSSHFYFYCPSNSMNIQVIQPCGYLLLAS